MNQGLSIFLAEDDEDDALLFKEVISGLTSNFYLHTFSNGEKLMTQLENIDKLPDIIFLDLNMPIKNGFQCLDEIKMSKRWRSIRTIILSTTSDVKQIYKCYSLGADKFLTKPNSYRELEIILKGCLT